VRHDVYIENDSNGFSVVPSASVADVIADDRRNDHRFAAEHRALMLILNGDDSFPARLVVNEPLTTEEESEWIARVCWRLRIPCGTVLLCGGFDPRALDAWQAGEDAFAGATHSFGVPAGDYRVDVYTHRPTASGRIIEDSWPRPLGTWFRAEHPGEPFPGWMADEFQQIPEFDPGHEAEWENAAALLRTGRLAADEGTAHAIGYLVHMQPWSPDSPLSRLPADGWFEPETGARVPPRCPRGLATAARPAD